MRKWAAGQAAGGRSWSQLDEAVGDKQQLEETMQNGAIAAEAKTADSSAVDCRAESD